jgi:pimeloyl-ACP methyl ester carboxylesterase
MLLMDALSIESAVLIGHSTGSSIALATALANPTRVKGLVLVSATDFKNGFPSLVRSLLKTQLGKDLMESLIRSEMGEIAIKRSWFCENDDIPLSVLDNYKLVSSQPNWHEALFLLAEASLDTQEDMALQLKQLVTTSEMPLLFMHGDQDRIVDVSESIELYNAVHEHAHTTFVELLNTGHVPHEEHSARVMSYLKDLLLAAASTDTR